MVAALLATLAATLAGCSADSGTSPGADASAVRTVRLTPATAEVGLGGTLQLALVALDANANEVPDPQAAWASADTTIATVSGTGLVTGRKLGVVQMQAVVNGQSALAVVSVVAARVAAVAVSPATASVGAGATVQLSARVTDGSGAVLTDRLVFWQSSNDAVARVTSTGLVSGVAAGSATITATSEGRSATAAVTVTAAVAPAPTTTRVDVTPGSASLAVGGTQQLTATPRDASGNARTGRTITWTSSDASVATVSGSGLVTAVRAGTATITATADGVSGTAAITVTVAVPAAIARVTVSPSSVTLDRGAQRTLTAIPTDAAGRTLSGRSCSWSGGIATSGKNSGKAVVTIERLTDTTARVIGRLEGNATVVATCEGQSGSASVKVED